MDLVGCVLQLLDFGYPTLPGEIVVSYLPMDGHVDISSLLCDALESLRDIRLSFPEGHYNKIEMETALGCLESILEPVALNLSDEEWHKVVLPSLEMVCRGCILIKKGFQESQKVNSAWQGGKIIGYDISEIPSLLSHFRRQAAVAIYYDLLYVLSCPLPRSGHCTDFSGSRWSAVTKRTFESYKYLVSKAISATEEMIEHAKSVDSLIETWAPYISQCDSIFRQIFGRLPQVKTGVSHDLGERIEDLSLGGFYVYCTGPKVQQFFGSLKAELYRKITEAQDRHNMDTENQLKAQYLDMDENITQINADVGVQEEIVVELFRCRSGGADYGVNIWPSSEIKNLIQLV